MRTFKLLFFASIVLAFLGAGFYSAVGLGKTTHAAPSRSVEKADNPPAGWVAPNGQRNLLLIGVDSLESSAPHLESLWLVLNLVSRSPDHFTLIPLLPASPGMELIPPDNLTGSFRLDGKGAPQPDFFEVLHQADFWWSYYAIVDRQGTGVGDRPGRRNGYRQRQTKRRSGCIQSAAGADDTQSSLFKQSELVRAFCSPQTKPILNFDAGKIFRKLGQHIVSDLPVERFKEDWLMPVAKVGYPTCEFPTLQTRSPGKSSN